MSAIADNRVALEVIAGGLEPGALLSGRPWSDLGNAQRLVDAHGDDLRYVAGVGWHHFTGDRWAADDTGEATRRMASVARDMHREAALVNDEEQRKKAVAWALQSQGARRIASALELSAVDERTVIRADELDVHPHLLAAANGTIDLRTGELRPSRRCDLITLATPVTVDPDAECPRWERFLAEVFDGDADLVAWMQRLVGYCLTGDTREHVLPVLHGDGANGKSTLVGVLERLLGPLALTAAFETFLDGRGGTADYDLARLRGARLVVASESAQGRRLDERIVKQVTGGDTITARHPYGRPFSYRPAYKVLLVTNHRPAVDGTDEAIWRRLQLIPFERSFRGQEDRNLSATLDRETAGILTWAIRGAVAWHEHGLGHVAAVGAATADYRAEEDTLGVFLADRCHLEPVAEVPVAELRGAYVEWCERHGERPVNPKTLTQALHRVGVQSKRTKRERLYSGVSVQNGGDR